MVFRVDLYKKLEGLKKKKKKTLQSKKSHANKKKVTRIIFTFSIVQYSCSAMQGNCTVLFSCLLYLSNKPYGKL